LPSLLLQRHCLLREFGVRSLDRNRNLVDLLHSRDLVSYLSLALEIDVVFEIDPSFDAVH